MSTASKEPKKLDTTFQHIQHMHMIRLRCAEIVFAHGSQEHRNKIDEYAERLYNFVVGSKKASNDSNG